jgi:hypothetical protein
VQKKYTGFSLNVMNPFIFELEESLNQLQHGMEQFPKVNDDDDENTLPWF